jgi:hypothetical protein
MTCELCRGTGWYGDNGPGRKGNREYQPCERCNPEGKADGLDVDEMWARLAALPVERDALKAELDRIKEEKQRTADAEVAHLGVAPEYFEAEDTKVVKAAEAEIAEAAAAERARAITPVPGGVGPMTVACLLANTVQAAEARIG